MPFARVGAKVIAADPILVGHRQVGPGHLLVAHRGLMWCWRCGAWSTEVARSLASPCPARPTRAGRDVLRRLAKGKTPKQSVQWPEPELGSMLPVPPKGLSLS